MTSGAVPERHRELVPHRRPDWQRPFRDGRAKPFHDGHAATQGGTDKADRCQCVGARGKNSTANSAEQASFAAENGARDRGERQITRGRPDCRCSRHGRSGRRKTGRSHSG